jgi:hypothetical protein
MEQASLEFGTHEAILECCARRRIPHLIATGDERTIVDDVSRGRLHGDQTYAHALVGASSTDGLLDDGEDGSRGRGGVRVIEFLDTGRLRVEVGELADKRSRLVITDLCGRYNLASALSAGPHLLKGSGLHLADDADLVAGSEEASYVDVDAVFGHHGRLKGAVHEAGDVEDAGGVDGILTEKAELVADLELRDAGSPRSIDAQVAARRTSRRTPGCSAFSLMTCSSSGVYLTAASFCLPFAFADLCANLSASDGLTSSSMTSTTFVLFLGPLSLATKASCKAAFSGGASDHDVAAAGGRDEERSS